MPRLKSWVFCWAEDKIPEPELEDILTESYHHVFTQSGELQNEDSAERLLHLHAKVLTLDWIRKKSSAPQQNHLGQVSDEKDVDIGAAAPTDKGGTGAGKGW